VHGGAVRNEDELGYRLSLPLAGFPSACHIPSTLTVNTSSP
jgi:hypothetical protein